MVYSEIRTRRYRNRNIQATRFTRRISFRMPFITNPERIETIVEELEDAADLAKWCFFLDLEGVRLMSACILQRLIPLCQEYQQQQFIVLPICNVCTELRNIIRLTRLTSITTEVPNAKDALKILAAANQPMLLRAVS